VNFLSVKASSVYTMTSRCNEIVRVTIIFIIMKLYYTETHSEVQNCSYEPVKEWGRDKLPMFTWLKTSLSLVQSVLVSSLQILWEIYYSQVHRLECCSWSSWRTEDLAACWTILVRLIFYCIQPNVRLL
jgi:hypothetical protein